MRVTDSERDFLHELHNIKKDPLGKRLIHFFVSLAPYQSDRTMRVERARAFIEKSFAKSPYVKTYAASNGDVFVAYSHISISEVLGVCSKVEKLFLDDVLSVRNAYNEYSFYKVSDAVKELDKVFAAFKMILSANQDDPEAVGKRPMSAENLAFLSDKLRSSDLRHCIFNQPVYYIGKKVPSIEFLEFYMASAQIEKVFLPEVSLTASPWLFHALKEDYDRATLRAVAGEIVEYRHKAFSVNVGITTILSKDFDEFYNKLPTKLAGKLVLEINKTDLVQNYALIREVRAYCQDKGLRLCLDGMEWRDFEIFSLARLQPDFVKVVWDVDVLSARPEFLIPLAEARKAMGENTQLVISRCDDPRAFPFARSLGANYVQGRLADQYFKQGMEL